MPAQTAGNLNAVVIGWNEAARNITSVTDSAGNIYQVGAATATSGTATTSFPRELLLGGGTTSGGFSGPGTGFSSRIITTPDAGIAEDRTVTSAGAYSATAPQSGSWVMQMAAFKGAGQ